MNTLTVNLHLLMATFYRPDARALPHRDRGRGLPVRLARGRLAGRATTAPTPRRRWCACARARARRRCAPRTSSAELERLRGGVALVLLGGVNYLTGELLDDRRDHRRGARHRRARRLGSRARRRQRPARAERLGRRLGRLVPLQVRQRRPRARRAARSSTARHGERRLAAAARRAGGATTRATRFRMEPDFAPRAGAAGWQVSTPTVLAFAPLRASLELFDEVGMPALRERSLRLTGYLESLLDVVVAERSARVLTPRDEQRRGCQLSLAVTEARALAARLRAEHGVICDVREPDVHPLRPDPALLELPRLLARRRRRCASCCRRGDARERRSDGQLRRAPPSRSPSSGCPRGAGPHPGVVLVHGGCWRAAYGRDLEHRVAADLAAPRPRGLERGVPAARLRRRLAGSARGCAWPPRRRCRWRSTGARRARRPQRRRASGAAGRHRAPRARRARAGARRAISRWPPSWARAPAPSSA